MNIRRDLARIKRRLLKKPFLKDPQFAPYWFNNVCGNKEAFIVQIGSNDGKTGDPLHDLLMKNPKWRALFVEPVPYIFERLKSNYGNEDRFAFENVAINNGENLDFFWVDPKAKDHLNDLPFWYDQLGSFNSQHIKEQLGKRIEPYILNAKLEGIQLPTLLQKNNVEKIDILHIDTEGHDWKILSQLELEKYHPTFILFEKNHLSEKEILEVENFLSDGYALFEIGIDGLAVSTTLDMTTVNSIKKSLKLW